MTNRNEFVNTLIKAQLRELANKPNRIRCKVNLFKSFELAAISSVLRDTRINEALAFDCVMVGDSFLTTYLRLDSTSIVNESSVDIFTGFYLTLLLEMRRALDDSEDFRSRLYLMADMPSGTVKHIDIALMNAERMRKYGADVLKVEIPTSSELLIVEELLSDGYLVFGHFGYTPQSGGRKSRAQSIDDAQELLQLIERAISIGVTGIVLEGVSTPFLELVSRELHNRIPIFAIFSGTAPNCGLSLNVWDAVYRPGFQARFFPESATLDQATFPASYTSNAISSHFWHLCQSVIDGKYPKRRPLDNDEVFQNWLNEVSFRH